MSKNESEWQVEISDNVIREESFKNSILELVNMSLCLIAPEAKKDKPSILMRIVDNKGLYGMESNDNIVLIDIKFIIISWEYSYVVMSAYRKGNMIDNITDLSPMREIVNKIRERNINNSNDIRLITETIDVCHKLPELYVSHTEPTYEDDALSILMYSLCIAILHEIGHAVKGKCNYAKTLNILNVDHAEEINADYYAVSHITRLPYQIMEKADLPTDKTMELIYRYVALQNVYNSICLMSFYNKHPLRTHPNPVDRIRYMDQTYIDSVDVDVKKAIASCHVNEMCNDFREAHATIVSNLFNLNIYKEENETASNLYNRFLNCLHSHFDKMC